jgi:hypothetical protein
MPMIYNGRMEVTRMEGLDRIMPTVRPVPEPKGQVKMTGEERISSEDICMDVEEMKSFLYMMSGIEYEPKDEKKDRWA